MRRKFAILGTQLRKSEECNRAYQLANQQLLMYVQYVHDVMSNHSQERVTPDKLARSCLEVIDKTRSLVEREAMPFGWEECYTEDNVKYYIK